MKKLIVNCFGDFKVIVTETNTELRWRTKKARELFAYLVHMQGKFVERNVLIEKLWPERALKNSVAAFHNIIYQTRRRLENCGCLDIIICEDRKYAINMKHIDTELVSVLKLGKAVDEEDMETLQSHRELILNYKGRYLENLEGDWQVQWVEYFETVYVKGCYMIALKEIEENCYKEAIQYLNIGLNIDIYAEHLAALLISCYGKLRDFKNMKNKYEKYTRILKEDLDLEYSEILDQAYRDGVRIS